jgi:hypothetical protein
MEASRRTRSRAEGDNRSAAEKCGSIRADPTARLPDATSKGASVSSDRSAQDRSQAKRDEVVQTPVARLSGRAAQQMLMQFARLKSSQPIEGLGSPVIDGPTVAPSLSMRSRERITRSAAYLEAGMWQRAILGLPVPDVRPSICYPSGRHWERWGLKPGGER